MGYRTYYTISTDCKDPETLAKINASQVDEDRLDHIETNGERKWYEHEAEMCDISTLFPDVTFRLCGAGEEALDVWVKWFRGGRLIAQSEASGPDYSSVPGDFQSVAADE